MDVLEMLEGGGRYAMLQRGASGAAQVPFFCITGHFLAT